MGGMKQAIMKQGNRETTHNEMRRA